jgi:lipid A 3-O-deacylase
MIRLPASGRWLGGIALVLFTTGIPVSAGAYDADATFAKGTVIAGVQIGGGRDVQLQSFEPTDVSFISLLPRLSILPSEPFGSSWCKSALEVGLEGWLQYYTEPAGATAFGLKAAVRYHLIGLGRLVPYVELLAGVGASSLNVREIDSDFTFVLEGGTGLAYMVTDRLAVNLGYRLYHVSNAGIQKPNVGVNAHEGVVGVSMFWK